MVYFIWLFLRWKWRGINTKVSIDAITITYAYFSYLSETFVIRDKEALRSQEHTVAFTDISRSRPMKSVTSMNTPSVKYLVLYVIRTGPMYISDNNKDISDGSSSTLKKTKNETNDLRRPYMVACKIYLFVVFYIRSSFFQWLICHNNLIVIVGWKHHHRKKNLLYHLVLICK